MSDDDYHRRTAITRLAVSPTDESLLRDTIEEWKRGCQIAVDKAWERCHSKSDVQQLAYDDVRENTSLGSQHAILACHQAAENIKSCISRRQDGKKASKPTYTSPTVTYDSRTMTPNRGYTPYSDESEAESTDKPLPQRANPSGERSRVG